MATQKSKKQSATGNQESPSEGRKSQKPPEGEDPPIIVKGGSVIVETRDVPVPTLPPHPKRFFGISMATRCTNVSVYERNGNDRGDLLKSFDFPNGKFWIELS